MKFKIILPLCALALSGAASASEEPFKITTFGTYSNEDTIFDESAAEIVAYNAGSQRFFVVNAQNNTVDALMINDEFQFVKDESCNLGNLDVSGAPNSVATHGDLVAVAAAATPTQDPGQVEIFSASTCTFIKKIQVGALPDMVTFNEDGSKILVANEGEPNDAYTVDPEGSVSIINVYDWSVKTADFTRFIGREDQLRARGVRIFGPGADAAMDLEPEYIAVVGNLAYVSLQENNAIAVVDIHKAKVLSINPLGTKNHNRKRNKLDYTNRDDQINIVRAPLHGMFQPDAIAAFKKHGWTYVVTANEGDARDYDGFSEEVRVDDLTLDSKLTDRFPGFLDEDDLGRPRTTTVDGDTDGDGDVDKVHTYGARSITVWKARRNGTRLVRVADTGSVLERAVAKQFPALFNANNDEDGIDSRSDDKGPEPEAIIIEKINGTPYAFVGLERASLIAIFDLSEPEYPYLVQLFGNRTAGATGLDLGPEGLDYIPAHESPTGKPLLAVANEVSGTTTLYTITSRY